MCHCVISRIFFSVAAPVATLLAIRYQRQCFRGLYLGNKVVLFVTGLVGAAGFNCHAAVLLVAGG